MAALSDTKLRADQPTPETPDPAAEGTSKTELNHRRKRRSGDELDKEVESLLEAFVGVWKLQRSENFDGYLKVQGIGYLGRALMFFLDFGITIRRKERGLQVNIHDYTSEFSLGISQPLLEHPVTKRMDQDVVVTVENGCLVARIYDPPVNDELNDTNSSAKAPVGEHVEAKETESPVARAESLDLKAVATSSQISLPPMQPSEVLILQISADKSEIKQTLQVQDVISYRYYVRDLPPEKPIRDWKLSNFIKSSEASVPMGVATNDEDDAKMKEKDKNRVKRGFFSGWMEKVPVIEKEKGAEDEANDVEVTDVEANDVEANDVEANDGDSGNPETLRVAGKNNNSNNSNLVKARTSSRPHHGFRRRVAGWIRKLHNRADSDANKRMTTPLAEG